MKTLNRKSTPAETAQVNQIFEDSLTLQDLKFRWADEKEFEDWSDYVEVIKKFVPKDATFVKAAKRPFSFDFILKSNGFTYRIIATNSHMEWKRIK
jgi:hypothetical protein